VPKLAKKTKPIVQLLRKASKFHWTNKCEGIFLQLKAFLAYPLVIQKLDAKEPIIVYLAMLEDAVSVVLVQEVEVEERPVYFVSRVLHGVEVRYQMIEKVTLALVITARRMRMYFQNHRVIVRSETEWSELLVSPALPDAVRVT